MPFTGFEFVIACFVVSFGAFTSKGKRRSSAIRTRRSRIASDTVMPISASVAAAWSVSICFCFKSQKALLSTNEEKRTIHNNCFYSTHRKTLHEDSIRCLTAAGNRLYHWWLRNVDRSIFAYELKTKQAKSNNFLFISYFLYLKVYI